MLRRRYGLEASDVESLIRSQGGRCAICKMEEAVHVDHDHRTGSIRGILCFSCNGGLGQFADDIDLLTGAASYLDKQRLLSSAAGLLVRHELRRCFGCLSNVPRNAFVNRPGANGDGSPFCRACYGRRDLDSEIAVLIRRHYRLRRRYGIGLEEHAALLEAQRGRCAICRVEKATDVDHDHARNIVRGLLCGRCNTGMGQFKDDPRIIRRAIDYLNSHRPHDVQEPAAPYILSVA